MVSKKAQQLLECIGRSGGGILVEADIREMLGVSHGTFSMARAELVKAGLLIIKKVGRQTDYCLSDIPQERLEKTPEKTVCTTNTMQDAPLFNLETQMPRVVGDFADMTDWEASLMEALGSCLDISESLVQDGEFLVYSHEFCKADHYFVSQQMNSIHVS